jgi:hypothetical protein
MLYTLLVLITGVYLGQEFTVIPSVKIAILNLMVYMKKNESITETTTNTPHDTINDSTIKEIIKWLKEKLI